MGDILWREDWIAAKERDAERLKCGNCGKPFIPQDTGGDPAKRYCSPGCGIIAQPEHRITKNA